MHFASLLTTSSRKMEECDCDLSNQIQIFHFIHRVTPYYSRCANGVRLKLQELNDPKQLPSLERIMNDLIASLDGVVWSLVDNGQMFVDVTVAEADGFEEDVLVDR